MTVAAVVLALCASFPANTSARSTYCSPTGDFCQAAQKKTGKVILTFTTFSFRGRIQVCVKKRSEVCHLFRLRSVGHGLYKSAVRWSRRFPNQGRGNYRVRWYTPEGDRLGVVITFRR